MSSFCRANTAICTRAKKDMQSDTSGRWVAMGWDGMEPVAVDGAGSGAGAGPMATDVASLLKSSQFGAHRSRR